VWGVSSRYVKSALDRLGFEFQRSATLRRFIATHPIDLVIDAGGNLGQFAEMMRSKGYDRRIWSFEPVSHVHDALAARAKKDPLWRTSKVALGSSPGQAEIHVMSNHTLSSFLAPAEMMAAYDSGSETASETVEVDTLDRLLADDPARSIFLKIDVQGFEKPVLEGARRTLDRVHALYVELPVEQLYEGGWSFPEAISYLDELGFTPAQFRPVNTLPGDAASAVEFDCLFRRKDVASTG
jgi:FkbM family methyltransferase